jgi:hypothetical protein
VLPTLLQRITCRSAADSVNPIAATREAWRSVAKRSGVAILNVAVVCSDQSKHRRRIEDRPRGSRASEWRHVISREFEVVDDSALMIDTAGRSVEQSLTALRIELQKRFGDP